MESVLTSVIILVFLQYVAPLSGPPSSGYAARILGGDVANPGEFPYLVSIQDISLGTNRHFCGGAIYSDSIILTAAHCMIDFRPSNIKVIAGEYDRNVGEGTEQSMTVSEIITHPDFNVDTYANDIAILKLSHKLHFNTFVKSIELPANEASPQGCVMAGWGATVENGSPVTILRKVSLPVWDEQACNSFLQDYSPECIGSSICAGEVGGGKDACHADDGGPLVCQGTKLIGLSSWGYGCGRANLPGVYIELAHYKQWIEVNTLEAVADIKKS